MLKKYKANSHVSLSVLLDSGKSTHVSFKPLTGGGSVFYTDDEALQKALESHLKYGKLFKLDQIQKTVAPSKVSVQKKEEQPEEQEAVVARVVKHEVTCNDDAKDYLVEKFGISRTKLRSRAQIEESGAANNVEFVWK